MEMSATPVKSSEDAVGITDTDRALQAVIKRLDADKRLYLRTLGDEDDLVKKLAERALKHEKEKAGRSVLVYVRRPHMAANVAHELCKRAGPDRVRMLTGTMRGHERDQLIDDPVFQRFLPKRARSDGQKACYLVSTSAGEVGADLDADAGVYQQDGRTASANRFGFQSTYS